MLAPVSSSTASAAARVPNGTDYRIFSWNVRAIIVRFRGVSGDSGTESQIRCSRALPAPVPGHRTIQAGPTGFPSGILQTLTGGQRPGLRDPAPDLSAHPAFGAPFFGNPVLAPDALGHPAVRPLRSESVQHRDQRAILPSRTRRVGGGGGRPETRHRSAIRPTGASSGRFSPSFATIPSPGPNARPDGTRICSAASPSSTLRTNCPFSSRRPSSRARASPSSPSSGVGSGQGSGSGSATSAGMPGQKGVRQVSTSGSSQTASPQSAAARSARVWTLSGNNAASKRTGPACAAQAAR